MRPPCRDKEFKRNLQSAVVCWTLDVGRWDVGTFERSDIGRWKLDVERWLVAVLLDVVGRCWTLLDVVGRCWTLLDVVGRCWTLLDVVGRCWTLFRRWTFGGWTSDVGCLRLHVGRRDIGRWDVGRWTLDAGRFDVDVGRWTLNVGRWTLDIERWTCGRADVGRRWDVGALDRTDVQTLDVRRLDVGRRTFEVSC